MECNQYESFVVFKSTSLKIRIALQVATKILNMMSCDGTVVVKENKVEKMYN